MAHALARQHREPRRDTLNGYRYAVKHLVPGVGAHRLDRLEPEHLEKVYVRMLEAGRAPATAHQVHRTVRAALNEAVRTGLPVESSRSTSLAR